ncbi:MAG: response regulator [Planctomycetes bacterium]|nr:response regulator [Planctomycetota bacterium]
MQPEPPEDNEPGAREERANARAGRSGRRLFYACGSGGALLVLLDLTAGLLSWPVGWLAPAIVAYVTAVLVLVRSFHRSMFAQVDDLETARREALRTALTKARLLANMSHEIRTPMNGILGMAELLVRTRLDAEQQQMAATIHASAESLLAVLNDILDYSKIEAGKLELEHADFDAWQVVDDCAGLLYGAAEQKGVDLVTYIDPRLWRCHRGDAARVRQIVLNLVSNAVKFTLEGEVVLGADLVAEDETSQLVRFWVRDTGVGISPEAMGRLFVPFAQADASTTRRFGGTGLGLVICRRLVEMMGGRMDVSSVPQRGSTFSFRLRLTKGELAHARPRAADMDLAGCALLLVDANETHRQLMAMQLAPTRIGIDVAGNALAAIELLRRASRNRRPFTMAIVDMTMPGFDGIQLAEAIRNDPEIRPLTVAIASSLGSRPGLAEMAAAEVFRWLNKPLAAGRLLQVVCDMASLRGGRYVVAPPPSLEETNHALVLDQSRGALRVMVAEDNEINRRVLAGMLRRIGCEVAFAADGREALQLIGQRDFDLVLMDCQMPEMDGFAATRAIRALGGRQATVPILALTANVLPADREACFAAGMDDFLSKPVKLDVLRAALQRWSATPAPAAAGQRS